MTGTKKKTETPVVQIPVWTWRDAVRQSKAPPLTKLVCYSIANYLADVGKGCFPSIKTLIRDTGLSNRSIATHIQAAIDCKLLVVERRKGNDGRHQLTHYLPRFPDNAVLPQSPAADMRSEHDGEQAEEDADNHVNELHADENHVSGAHAARPDEAASSGPGEPDDTFPRELHHVNLVQRELSIREPSTRELSTPPQPPADRGGRERGKKRVNEVEAALSLVRSEQPHVAARVEAVDRVLAPIVRRLRLDAPSLEGSLRSLADWIALKALSADEADAIVAAIVADRKATVKPSDIETAVKVRVAKRPAEAVLAGEPELMAKWPAVMAWLENKLGREKAQLTFSTFVIESIRTISGKGVVIANLATHLDFKRSEVELSYSAQLRAAVASVFPEVTGVWIETRRAAA